MDSMGLIKFDQKLQALEATVPSVSEDRAVPIVLGLET